MRHYIEGMQQCGSALTVLARGGKKERERERERDSRPHADMHACVYMHRHPAATLQVYTTEGR